MALREAGLEHPAAPALEDREVRVLRELAGEGEARVAFQGLRRRLELHQEALARTLRRLEGSGLVAREPGGYKLTEQGFAALQGRATKEPPREVVTVVQALLPPHLGSAGIAGHLARRWFRGLRWYGQAEEPGETTMTWLAEPGNAKVRVRIAGGALSLEVEAGPDGPSRAFAAARGILVALAELYGVDVEGSGSAGAFGEGPGFAA